VSTQFAPAAHIPEVEMTRDSGFHGRYMGDALPVLPRWTITGFQWAPSVWARPDGTYVMYYSTPATIPLICLAKHGSPGCIDTAQGWTSAMCLAGDEPEPHGTIRRRLDLGLRVSLPAGGGHRPQRVRGG
jgi:hypothetical protein